MLFLQLKPISAAKVLFELKHISNSLKFLIFFEIFSFDQCSL